MAMSTESDSEDISEEIADESYHDDPELLVDIPRRNILAGFTAFLMLLAGTSFYLPSTVGARIVLNSSATNIQFGQGSSLFVYCGGAAAQIQVNLGSYFSNQTSIGNMYLNQVQFSQIPTSCSGAEFTKRIYDDVSSTPLTLFGTTSQLIVDDTSGTFFTDCTDIGIDVSSNTTGSGDGFTAVFATPILLSTTIAKITIETRNQTLTAPPLINIGSSFTFSNPSPSSFSLGSQQLGPTLSQLRTLYSGTSWAQNTAYLNVVTLGFQRFHLCFAGVYEVVTKGGNGGGYNAVGAGGKGASVTGRFTFASKQLLTIVVGHAGNLDRTNGNSSYSPGGGGSFVFLGADTSTTGDLVAAGGGGGISLYSVATADANLSTSGNPGCTLTAGGSFAGGIGGNGGSDNSALNTGGAGGGVTTSGGDGSSSGGQAISKGAIGGNSGYPPSGIGSFGGGGGIINGGMAGGGGGYSGGGAGSNGCTALYKVGGGGGSYIAPTATNTSLVLASNPFGSVKITRIS